MTYAVVSGKEIVETYDDEEEAERVERELRVEGEAPYTWVAEAIEWRCTDCGDTFLSVPTRHSMDYCDCGEQWVDHEEHYIRRSMGTEAVEQPETKQYPPHDR